MNISQSRRITQVAFFTLFILAPPLDIFRLDLNLGHFILFGFDWRLGLAELQSQQASASAIIGQLLLRAALPLMLLVVVFIWIGRRYGRLYCGWLCPHFSVVESINHLMLRASGKPSLWLKKPLPSLQADGRIISPHAYYWPITLVAVLFFSFVWAVTLLTYLLPPVEIYHNLFTASLTRNQLIFLSVATALFCIEFLLARHLFCRFGCAVGVFLSLAWMGNRNALVVGFDHKRAKLCSDCNNACDNVCPMRLKPRSIKRKIFTCTQCRSCINACEQVQNRASGLSLLKWLDNECAHVVAKDFGKVDNAPRNCFEVKK